MSRDHGLVARLLILALLHLAALPALADVQGALTARWSSRATRDLMQALTGTRQILRVRATTLAGERLQGAVVHRTCEADSLYAARLSTWSARHPTGLQPLGLGDALLVENRFERGKPLSGSFTGFDGPLLLLETSPAGTRRALPMDGLRISRAGDQFVLDQRKWLQPEDWPPSRSTLEFQVKGNPAAPVRILPLDSLCSLDVVGGPSNLILFLLPAGVMALLNWGLSSEEWNIFGSGVM